MPEQQYPEPTVGALIFNPEGKVFLMRSHKWRGKWVLPGGHIELGERMEDALNAHLIYLAQFIREKQFQIQARSLTDFVPLTYRDREGIQACLSRNTAPILILTLLAVVGFAGAYVAILRYDVR